MSAVWVKVGAAVLAAPALVVTAPELGAHPGAGDRQPPADPPVVALPVTPPPGDPRVAILHYADPVRSGRVMVFRYPAFTLYACGGAGVAAATDPCRSAGTVPLRTVRRDDLVTRFSLTVVGPAPARDDLVRAVRAYVVRAELTTAPSWWWPATTRPGG